MESDQFVIVEGNYLLLWDQVCVSLIEKFFFLFLFSFFLFSSVGPDVRVFDKEIFSFFLFSLFLFPSVGPGVRVFDRERILYRTRSIRDC